MVNKIGPSIKPQSTSCTMAVPIELGYRCTLIDDLSDHEISFYLLIDPLLTQVVKLYAQACFSKKLINFISS